MFLLVACCVILPVVELAVFIQVAHWIGGWEALLLLLGISLLGVWLMKAQGLAVSRKARAELAAGRVPGRPVLDGLLVFCAGLCLLFPGFVTAIGGLVLLLPPTRVALRELLIRRVGRRVRTTVRTVRGPGGPVIAAGSIVVSEGSDPQQLGRQRAIQAGDEALG